MRIIFLSFFLSISAYAQSENINTKKLSLKEAFEIARKENPSFLQTKESLNQSSSATSLAKSGLLPTISATAQAERKKDAEGVSGTVSSGNAHDEYNAGLHLSQPLYARGTFSAVDSAEKDQLINKLNVSISDRDLGSNVIQTYYQIVLNLKAYDTLIRQQGIVEESLKVTEHRKQIGRSQLLDVLQVKTQIALLKSQVVDAKNVIDVASINFSNFLGSPSQIYAVQDKMDVPDFNQAIGKISGKKAVLPEIEQNKLLVLQIQDLKDVMWGKNLPTLNLIGDYNFQTNHASQLVSDRSKSWDVGIALNIPLFSGFSSFDQSAVLNSQKRQLEFAGKNLENQNSLQVVTSKKQLENALANVNAGIEALNYAKQSSNEAIRQYKTATIDFLQFLTVQNSYVQAEQSLNTSKFNYIAAITSYYSANGQSMDDLIELIENGARL